MENEININLSNEIFISLFDNRIEENRNFNIINYIHNYVRNESNINLYNRNLYNLRARSCLSLLDT